MQLISIKASPDVHTLPLAQTQLMRSSAGAGHIAMADEVLLAVMGTGLYETFDVRIDPNASVKNITSLMLSLVGDRKPLNSCPAFSFETSRGLWQSLDQDKRLVDYSLEGTRLNVCIWWRSDG